MALPLDPASPVDPVPVVDITPLLAPKTSDDPAACRDAMFAASVTSGFFVAVGHGLDVPMSDVFAQARSFLARPQDEKEQVQRIDRYGYVPHRSQALDTERMVGDVEYLDVGLADEVALPAALHQALRRYQAPALRVGRAIVAALAQSLDLAAGTFEPALMDPQCRLRLAHYLPTPLDSVGCHSELTASHTDYGLITLLATDGRPGLEVQDANGEWGPVIAPSGSLIVNLGDMLARWTNDRFRSTPHRVVGSPGNDRLSIPFFINPNPATVVECLPSCVTDSRPRRYEPVTAGAFLAARIDGRI